MKKTQIIEVFANIKQTWINFLSVFMFVFLGIAVFVGLEWTGMDLITTAEEHFQSGNMSDYEITFPYGVTDDDLNRIRDLSCVSEVEGIYSTYRLLDIGDSTSQAHIISISDDIDTLNVIQGELPQKANEICLDKNIADGTGLKIGDKVTFKSETADEEFILQMLAKGDTDTLIDILTSGTESDCDILNYSSFKITAIVENPRYMNCISSSYGTSVINSMQADSVFYVSEDAFNKENLSGYGCALVRCKDLENLNSFSKEYEECSSELQNELSAEADEIAKDSYESVISTFDEIAAQLKADIEYGENKIQEGSQLIVDSRKKLTKTEKQIASKRKKLNKAKKQFLALKDQLTDEEYAAGKAEYLKAVRKINSASSQVKSGKSELKAYEADLQTARSNLQKLQNYYDEWTAKSDEIEDYGAIISAHTANPGCFYVDILSDIIRKMKYSMGGLFLLISFLICYSVITRLVNLQEKNIGTKKALGFTNCEIEKGYLLYIGLAVIAGSIPGVLTAKFIIEPILAKTVCTTYTFECVGEYYSIGKALIVVLCELFVALAVTWLACRRMLKKEPVAMIAGKIPAYAKPGFNGRLNIWKKSSVLTKAIVNNITNDSTRVIATLIGVAGCCALIVSSMTMNGNIMNCFNKQHSDYVRYDKIIYYDNTVQDAADDIREILEDNGITYSEVYRTGAYIGSSDIKDTFTHIIVYGDSYKNVMTAESTDKSNVMKYEGVWIPESIQKYYDMDEGKEIELKALDGTVQKVKIDGYYHHYSYRLMTLIDRDTYKSTYGYVPDNNAFLLDTGSRTSKVEEITGISSVADESNEANDKFNIVEKELRKVDGYLRTYYDYDSEEADAAVFKLISRVFIEIYIIVSVLMAVFVLLNLLLVFVDEKKRELIILMINGYSVKDAQRYIYSDTILLGILGIILGIIIGWIAGDWSTGSFESQYLYALHDINWKAAICGASITAILTAVMSWIAMRRIREFELSDINK